MPNGEEKFAPPPPNISIRTMASDEEALRSGGGQVSPVLPQEPVAPPTPEAFLPAEPPPPPATPPPIAPVHAAPTAPMAAPYPSAQPPKKTPWLLIILITAAIVGLAVAGYFAVPLIMPKPSPIPTPPIFLPSPTFTPSPTPGVTLPLNIGAENQVSLEIDTLTPASLLGAIKTEASSLKLPGSLTALSLTSNQLPLTLNQFWAAAAPNASSSLAENFAGQYFAGLYYAKEDRPYLVLAVNVLSAKLADFKAAIRAQESTTLEKDFSLVTLGQKTTKKKGAVFGDAAFAGAQIRYVDYETPAGMGFYYAFISSRGSDYFVISANRDALFDMLRRLY